MPNDLIKSMKSSATDISFHHLNAVHMHRKAALGKLVCVGEDAQERGGIRKTNSPIYSALQTRPQYPNPQGIELSHQAKATANSRVYNDSTLLFPRAHGGAILQGIQAPEAFTIKETRHHTK